MFADTLSVGLCAEPTLPVEPDAVAAGAGAVGRGGLCRPCWSGSCPRGPERAGAVPLSRRNYYSVALGPGAQQGNPWVPGEDTQSFPGLSCLVG